MNIIRRVMISSVLAFLVLPVQAAVIDQVKNKVEAIKNDTNVIKSKSNELLVRANEAASTAHSQVLETVDIKEALAPLFALRDRFSELDIDPSELLDMIDTDEITALLDDIKQQRADTEAAMADVESFRIELLGVLSGINGLIAEGGEIEISPLQTIVENVPGKALAVLKIATGDVFLELIELVTLQVESMSRLQELGILLDNPLLEPLATTQPAPNNRFHNGLMFVHNPAPPIDGVAIFCNAWGQALEVPVLAITTYQIRNAKIIHRLDVVGARMSRKEKKIPFQVHGYIGMTLEPGRNLTAAIANTKMKLELQQDKMDLIKEYISFLSLSGACGIAGELI